MTICKLIVLGVCASLALAVTSVAARGPQEPVLPELLDNVASYLEQYDGKLSAVISQEDYSQTETTLEGDPAQPQTRSRSTKSELLLLNGGAGTWLCFRDVFQVDGKMLPDHVGRLAKLLATSPAESSGAGSLANQLAWESARYNLGGVTRNFNTPTMALTFLRRQNQARSSFRRSGTEHTDGHAVFVVSFAELHQPTLVRGYNDQDVSATGRAWIEASGRVDKTELSLRAENNVNALVTVTYGSQPNLSVAVPLTMHEHYQQSILDRIEAFARYSNFVLPKISVDVEGFKLAAERTGRGGGGF